mmetsp:Transcript_28717/g.66239  ORF Transcript_28717/g.66239 Transcript_28717/m.66239 type:complete len:274 (+) Transcript_28717:37-858(+)
MGCTSSTASAVGQPAEYLRSRRNSASVPIIEFAMECRKQGGESIGLDLKADASSRTLVVMGIAPGGLAASWRGTSDIGGIERGDRVVAVNASSGDCRSMLKRLSQETSLLITFQRYVQFTRSEQSLPGLPNKENSLPVTLSLNKDLASTSSDAQTTTSRSTLVTGASSRLSGLSVSTSVTSKSSASRQAARAAGVSWPSSRSVTFAGVEEHVGSGNGQAGAPGYANRCPQVAEIAEGAAALDAALAATPTPTDSLVSTAPSGDALGNSCKTSL